MNVSKSKMKLLSLLLLFVLGASLFTNGKSAFAAGEVTLYTPYTSISVPPGETINYSVEVYNNTNSVVTAPLQLSGLPENWTAKLNSGAGS